jgi:hypothetical protein
MVAHAGASGGPKCVNEVAQIQACSRVLSAFHPKQTLAAASCEARAAFSAMRLSRVLVPAGQVHYLPA